MGRMQHTSRRVQAFTNKYPLLGPLIWILSVQYFAVQFYVASRWPVPFKYDEHLISDLGNTACGVYSDRLVCSPDYALMNWSFIMLGITMALGALFIYQGFRKTRATFIGFILMALAGFGTFLVGMFPENTIGWAHALGAALALGVGNLSLLFLAFGLRQVRQGFRLYTFSSGMLSLIVLGLFVFNINFGLGQGTMERIVSYPQTAWLILLGLHMSATRIRARHNKTT